MTDRTVSWRAGHMGRVLITMTWDDYLAGFTVIGAGITDEVLRRSRAAGTTPYGWLAAAVLDHR
jgi:hypothetical protein